MALTSRRLAPWLLVATWAAGCNSIFGIEEGRPRPDSPDQGGEPPHTGGKSSAGTTSGGSHDAGGGSGGSAGASNAGALNGGQGGAGAPEAGGGGVAGGNHDFAGEAGVAGQPFVCEHARWPTRPAPGDGSTLNDIVLAANSLIINQTEVVGRDIDNSCTCPEASTCTPPGSPDLVCDGSNGRDANVNKVMATLVQLDSAFSESSLSGELANGRAGFVFRIRGYNGTANDDAVSVELFGRSWTNGVLPQHDGNDTWLPYKDSLAFDLSVEWDQNAFVRDSLLVAKFPTFTLAFRPNVGQNDNPFIVKLQDAVLSGTLEQGSSGFVLKNGNMAARWPTASFLDAFSVIQYPFSLWMCGNNLAYTTVRGNICKYADVMGSAAGDNTNAACDAVSWAAGFDAEPAKLGAELSPPSIPSGCDANWKPSCF